jgi:hypothetical protein
MAKYQKNPQTYSFNLNQDELDVLAHIFQNTCDVPHFSNEFIRFLNENAVNGYDSDGQIEFQEC